MGGEVRLDPIDAAVERIAAGGMVVVVDDPDRENEGDLVIAADAISAEAVNFMAVEGRGLICVAMPERRLDELRIPPMAARNNDAHGTAFRVSVDATEMVSTGISAADRARTIATLGDPGSRAGDLVRPGHVFPLAAREGGVLARAGHTEASLELCELAGRGAAAVICEIAADDGRMARLPELRRFADRHGMPLVAVADLLARRRASSPSVERISSAPLPLAGARFTAVGYRDLLDGHEHLALTLGDLSAVEAPLVRVHSECLSGDVLRSRRCDCAGQLERAIELIAAERAGALVYLRGGELGLDHQQGGREHGAGAQILAELGLGEVRLLGEDPAQRAGLERHGLRIRGCAPVAAPAPREDLAQLRAVGDLGPLFGDSVSEGACL